MKHDPLHQDIVAGLSQPLNGDTFEACAAYLLRSVFPGLVPVRGGQDAGFDGAISDLQGEPYPLVCTTRRDPVRNFRESLGSLRKNGYQGDQVVFATSRQLTPAQRQRVQDIAKDHGFIPVQIYDQAPIADLLYDNPVWCKELLGLSGAPAALSISPLTSRPLHSIPLVGRDDDLAWLRETKGDRLIVGQPGSGKTFLLHELAREGWGLFLVDDDRERIANSLRKCKPGAVIVDDAHVEPHRLVQLRQLRSEIHAEFDIVATCWTGRDGEPRDALQLASSQVRELPLLTRDQMVQIVRSVGLGGPDALIGEIVTQASGRPGLAVTLVDLCWKGDVQAVVLGDAIAGSIKQIIADSSREEDFRIMAAFALGGGTGMPEFAVAKCLGIPAVQIAARLANLGHAGVLATVPSWRDDDKFIAVYPPALRWAIIRESFFGGPGSIDFRPLAELAPDRGELVLTLVGAQARGARMNQQLLQSYLDEASSNKAWIAYASLGPYAAEWTLLNRPDLTAVIADPALHHSPRTAIPALLDLATKEPHVAGERLTLSLGQIEEWVRSAHPIRPEGMSAVERRRMVIDSTLRWMRNGGKARIGTTALMIGLEPEYFALWADPGAGNTITHERGTLFDPDLEAIFAFWPRVKAAIESAETVAWPDVFSGIAGWGMPTLWQQNPLPIQSRELMRSKAVTMLQDVVAASGKHRGVLQRAQSLAQRARLGVAFPQDQTFSAIFGEYGEFGGRRSDVAASQANEDIGRLINSWKQHEPVVVASELASLEEDAAAVGITFPRRVDKVAEGLSAAVDSGMPWLEALLAAELGGDAVYPFLRRATSDREDGWEKATARVLNSPHLTPVGIRIVLSMDDPPIDLLEDALNRVSEHPGIVEWCVAVGLVPASTLSRLLLHEDDVVAGMAAYGEWESEPRQSVRSELSDEWRQAFLRDPDEQHQWVILQYESQLAHDWLRRRIEAGERFWLVDSRGPVSWAIDALSVDERRSILSLLKNENAPYNLVARLVGDDATLYSELLELESLEMSHPAPLSGELNQSWIDKAKVALRHGISPERIAGAVLTRSGVFAGGHSSVLAAKIDEMERFAVGKEPDIVQILKIAIDSEKANLARQLASEHREAVHGIR